MNRPFFATDVLPVPFRHGLRSAGPLRHFLRGETIYQPGMREFVGYVISGAVKLVTLLPDGRSNIIGVIEAPGFFGRIFGVTAEVSIEAASDVVLACFDRSAFEAQLSTDPELEHSVHMENLHQLEEAHERITVLACQSIIQRLATFLVLRMLASQPENARRNETPIVNIPINRRDFAAYLGTTVETVSRSIQALVRRGTISVIDSATFVILRRHDLIEVAGQDEDSLLELVRSRRHKGSAQREYCVPASSKLAAPGRVAAMKIAAE